MKTEPTLPELALYEERDHSGLRIGHPYSEPWMKRNDPDDPGFRVAWPSLNLVGCGAAVSEEMRKFCREVVRRCNSYEALVSALEHITLLGGNLPDDELTRRTGPNDSVARGMKYVAARQIARATLAAVRKEGK